MPEACKAPRRRDASSRPSTPTICSRASRRPSSRAPAPTSSTSSTTGPTSTRTPSSDVSTWPTSSARPRAASTRSSRRRARSTASGWPCRTRSSAMPSPTGSRGCKEAGADEYPKTWDDARKVFAALKKKGKPYGQTLGHTFGDAPTFTYTMLWSFGGAETDKTRQEGRAQQQGRRRVGQVHAGVLEGVAATRAGSPGTTPTTTAPSTPARSRPP